MKDGRAEQMTMAELEDSEGAGHRLADAIEALAEGFALFDRDDRLVRCNARYRELHALMAPALVPGARFEELLRFGLARGQYVIAAGGEAAWLADRLAAHRRSRSVTEQALAGGRWLRLAASTTPDGGRVLLAVDVTELERRERRLADIIDGADVGSWEWNRVTGEVRLNERWAGLLGHSLAELAPLTLDTWRQLCHRDDLRRAEAALAAHLAGVTAFYECEVRMRHRAGHWVWLLDRGRVASRAADGCAEWVSGTHLDITERKVAEAALESSRRRLDQLLAASPAVIYAVDATTFEPTYVSGNCRLLYGDTPEAILGNAGWWTDHLHADDRDGALARLAAWIEDGATAALRHSYRLRRADGSHVWVEDQLRALRGADGTPSEFVGSHIDITDRKRLEQRLAEERDFLDRIMATSVSAVAVLDAEGRIVFANREAERLLGSAEAPLADHPLDDAARQAGTAASPPLPPRALPLQRVLTTGAPLHDFRLAITGADGRRRVLSINAARLAAGAAMSGRVVCSIADITERLQADRALQHQEALLRGLFELSPVGIALNDFETGRFLDANAALLGALGYSKEELSARSYFDVTPGHYHPLEVPQRRRLLTQGHYGPFEKEYVRRDGSRYPVLLNGILVKDLDGRPLIWSIIEDISERKAETARMLHSAQHDPLTGLANRRLFQDRLAQALERARRGRGVGAVAMLDLDHFKPVNDRLGHRAGDAILIEAASRLAACTRKTDTVARFGGDEFIVLLDAIAAVADAAAIADKMQAELSRPFALPGQAVELGVSIGISLFPADSDDLGELLHMADIAMYAAKRTGRRRSQFYEAGLADQRRPRPPADDPRHDPARQAG